jgi:hypothetical protein
MATTPLSGWLIYYSDPTNPDLAGDYFNAQTDLDLGGRRELSTYFEHGQEEKIGRRRIGRAQLTQKSGGLWVSVKPVPELPAKVWDSFVSLANDGLMGFSSGAPGHLVERERRGNTHWIKRWPLIDASLTVGPCESRCMAQVGDVVKHQGSLDARIAKVRADYLRHLQAVNDTRLWWLEYVDGN